MSNMSDQDVIIRILTAFEKGGIDAAKQAAQELQQAIDANSDSGKTLSGLMEILDGKADSAGKVFQRLSAAMRGGTGAVNGLATATKGLAAAFNLPLGPISVLITAVQLAVTAWSAWTSHAEAAAEASKKAAEEAEAAAKEAAEALEKDMAAAADAVTAKLKAITDELKAGVDQANKLADAAASVNDAQLGLELAKLDARLVGETDEGKIADIKQQKAQLKIDRERERIDEEYAAQGREISAMDEAEQQSKKTADDKSRDLEEAENRWSEEEGSAENRVASARAALEQERAIPPSVYDYDIAERVLAREQAEQELSAAEAALKETSERITGERAVLEHETKRANQNYDNLVAANAPKRQILQKQMDANRIKAQTLEVQSEASEHQYSIDTLGIYDRQQAAAEAAAEEQAEKARQAAVDRDKNMTPGERLRLVQGLVRPEQQVGEKLYGGEPGIGTQHLAQTAIADAARKIKDGEEDQAVIQQLVDTLQKMGAVIPKMGLLVSQLNKMDGEIDKLQLQIDKNR